MKLVIQIPCLNEEASLPATLADLPHELEPFDTVEWLVVDDGSTDRTVEVARALGVDHIISFNSNKGLAVAFQAGIDAALKLGADVIVNTDADNQYHSGDISTLVAPIVHGQADMVVGDRQIKDHDEFTRSKKVLQRLGSRVVRGVSDTDVPDATSGFRAYTRDAALRLNVVSRFTYTLETLIQAGKSDIAVTHVPVRTNPKMRESRLFKSTWGYIKRQVGTILRISVMYEPLPIFMWLAAIFGLFGTGLVGRFVWHYLNDEGPTGRIQSLVLGAALLILAVLFVLLGVLGDLLRANRIISEQTLRRVRRIELSLGIPPDDLVDKELADPPPEVTEERAPDEARP